jgi:hypothetical protein
MAPAGRATALLNGMGGSGASASSYESPPPTPMPTLMSEQRQQQKRWQRRAGTFAAMMNLCHVSLVTLIGPRAL